MMLPENSGVINIKTKKNKMKGLNGSLSATLIQSKFTRTNNSLNLNYRTGKVNIFGNYGYSYWQGYNDLTLERKFRNFSTKEIETIFDQSSLMNHNSTYQNLKVGMDFYANKKTTLGVVLSGYINPGNNTGDNTTLLKKCK